MATGPPRVLLVGSSKFQCLLGIGPFCDVDVLCTGQVEPPSVCDGLCRCSEQGSDVAI
jgi:hypothetical protein